MNDARPNKFKTWCSLCGADIAEGAGLVTQRDVPKEDGTTDKKWIADCKEVEACHERIRAKNRKRSAAAKARNAAAGGSGRLEVDHKTGRKRWRT